MEEAKKGFSFKGIISFIKNNDRLVVSYLGLIIIGLISFNIGGARSNVAMVVLSCLMLTISMYLVVDKKEGSTKSEKKALLIFLLPLFIFLFILCFSNFWRSFGGISSVLSNFISLFGIFGCFFFAREIKNVKGLKTNIILFPIAIGLAFASLLNLFANLVDYGFFHLLLYKGKVYFYDGVSYPLDKEMAAIDGFLFKTTTINFASLPMFLSSLFLVGSFFTSPKKDLQKFLFYIIPGSIGVLSLVLVGNLLPVFILIFIYLAAIIFKFSKLALPSSWWERGAFGVIGFGIFAVLGYMFVVASKGDNTAFGTGIIRKICDNSRLTRALNQVVDVLLGPRSRGLSNFLLGMPVMTGSNFTSSSFGGESVSWVSFSLHTFEYSALMEGGIFVFIFLCLFILTLFPQIKRFVCQNNKNAASLAIFSFLLGYFIYQSIFMDSLPFLGVSNYFSPIHLNPYFFIAITLVGSLYSPSPTIMKLFSKEGK